MTVLRLDAVTYTYAGRPAAAPALRDVSLTVEPGELVLLAGLSGSGKSTLLRAACGLVPHFHGGEMSGRVVVGGLDTREHGPGALAAVCGTLLQDPETQIVMGTVRSELAFGLENRGLGAAAVAREVEEVALALGIAALLERPTHELSGGELQRVALGAALAGRPELVVLDEPTSQLDPVAGDELVWLVRRLNEQWGTAVVLAEQRLERCLPAADRVVAMDDGRIVCDAPPADFLAWASGHCPALETPAARLFGGAGLGPLPTGVKTARAALRAQGLLPAASAGDPAMPPAPAPAHRPGRRAAPPCRRGRSGPAPAIALRPRLARGARRADRPARRLARDRGRGAGRADGPQRRRQVDPAAPRRRPRRADPRLRAAGGRVALLLQTPGDYLVHERAGDELRARRRCTPPGSATSPIAIRATCPGGERQRLALAIVTAAPRARRAAAGRLCLDEPTRGMDDGHRDALVARLEALAAGGAAVVVATHDPELAAAVADRVVLLGDGEVVADGPRRRGPGRRLVLRDRDRARAGRRRRRAAARRGRGDPAGAAGGRGRGTAGRPGPGGRRRGRPPRRRRHAGRAGGRP